MYSFKTSLKSKAAVSIHIAVLTFILNLSTANAQTGWYDLGTGANNWVWCATIYGGYLTVGGDFTNVSGVSANRIARWNGTTWSALGLGTNARVSAFTIYNGLLIVGGSFTQVGGTSVNRIASWNGTNWTTLGSGFNDHVQALAVYNTQLYAAGSFTLSGTDKVSRIAVWNGTSWGPVGLGLDNYALALRVYNSELYVGGAFLNAGSIAANRIAKWNGTTWTALGLGVNSQVRAFTTFGSLLIAAGDFTAVGGIGVNRIASWNGSWGAIGLGTNSSVYALTVFNGQLVAGGFFTSAGGISANRIAQWSGSVWSTFGNGFTGGNPPTYVLGLTVYNSQLIAGGIFSDAGGTLTNNIARWVTFVGVNGIGNTIPETYKLYQNYPNPFNPSTKIQFALPKSSFAKIVVYDMLGKEIETLVNEQLNAGTYEADFDGSKLSSGVYYYKLIAGDFTETKKMVLMK